MLKASKVLDDDTMPAKSDSFESLEESALDTEGLHIGHDSNFVDFSIDEFYGIDETPSHSPRSARFSQPLKPTVEEYEESEESDESDESDKSDKSGESEESEKVISVFNGNLSVNDSVTTPQNIITQIPRHKFSKRDYQKLLKVDIDKLPYIRLS